MSDKKQQEAEQPRRSHKIWLWIKRWWLPIAIPLITSAGLACALSIPQRVFETPREPANDKSAPVLLAQSNLRLAFLYITGGAIAVMGLIETFRKNNNEKLKNDQEKEKNDRDHLRQVRAGRRERYTKAVEQLGDEKAPIRMGGVYTLVGLVDEWLEEESIRKYEDRLKEGQVIINNLCAYIRSPFTLTTRYDELSEDSPTSDGVYKDNQQEFYKDKAEFKAETDVRRSIIKEIHDRLQGPEENTPGTWSDFEYDFSGSTFFYPVDLINSYYKKSVTFRGSTYQDWAVFGGSTYKGWADFSGSTYEKAVTFSTSLFRSTYVGRADFGGSTYQDWADFSGSTYQDETDFSGSIFYQETYFGKDGYSRFSRFTNFTPQFYNETNNRKTLFGSHNNDFTVDTNEGYPIVLNSEGIPLKCEFLNSEQKKHLENSFQEIEKINNKLFEVKDPKEKAELSKKLQALNEELHEWREEVTTVKVEDVAAEDTES